MAIDMSGVFRGLLGELRVQATPFRIRGVAGARVIVDSSDALLVWEPRRITPVYAVRRADIATDIQEVGAPRELTPAEQQRPVLDPSIPFDAHTTPGVAVSLPLPGGSIGGFIADDDDLRDHVLIDFAGLTWREEETEVFAHPRDPSQRIDVRPTRSRLQLAAGGTPIVDTRRARRLWQTMLPVRWYVPEADVLVPLEPSGTVTWCAYKGMATYRSAILGAERLDDIAWTYEHPLDDGREVQGLLGFYTERLDMTVDGVRLGQSDFFGA